MLDRIIGAFSSLEPGGFLLFGILLLGGVLGGIAANRIKWLPTITAFMIVGFVLGDHGLNILNPMMLAQAKLLIDIALGLILFSLGCMLHPQEMIRSRKLQITALAESGLTFLVCTGVVYAFGFGLAASLLIGAIAISSSPAVLVHVSEELEADGPVSRRARSLVAVNNLASSLVFTMVLPFALIHAEANVWEVVGMPVYRFLAAAGVGVAVAWLAVNVSRQLRPEETHYRFAIIIGAIMFTLGLAKLVGASVLVAPLALGIATRWFERRASRLSDVHLGEGVDIFFIILFVIAGAKLDIEAIIAAGIIPIVLVIVRSACKFAGVMAARPVTGITMREASATSLLLIPMAGMAIGLVTTLHTLAPELGVKVSAVILGMVAVFETIGPFAAVKALHMAGEVGKAVPEAHTSN